MAAINPDEIASIIGKENMMIKTHPRDTRTIYADNGYKVDINSDVPWEAIQLAGDFSDHVFLSTTSCSVLAGSLMSIKPISTIYLFKLCNLEGNRLAKRTVECIVDVLSSAELQNSLSGVKVIDTIEDMIT